MRILVFSWRDTKHPLAGGAEQVMHEHMKGWVAAGNSVTLFTSKTDALSDEETIDGIKIIRRGYQYLGVQVAGFLFYLKNKSNFDFIVDQFHGTPFFTPIYSRKPKLAVIQETAQKVWFLNPLPFPINWVIGALGYIFEPLFFVFYHNTQFMTGSESAREDVSRFGRIPLENITVVPHGVIILGKPVGKKEKIKTIAYLGILSKDKGIEDALRCFSILNERANFNFWVIGKAETKSYGDKIQRMVSSLGLNDKVKFWGFVSQEKKFELLSRAHLLVNPSIHEGWGLVNIEANAMGTPVVSYKSAGLIDSVRDGVSGILCKNNTPQNLAQDVVEIFSQDKKYEGMIKSSISWSKNFSWDRSKRQSLNLINKIANEV